MSFARSVAVAQADLPGFKLLADQMETQDWHDFNVALEAILPLLEGWHAAKQKRLPPVFEIAQAIGFDNEKTARVLNVLLYLSGHGVKMLTMTFEFQENDHSFPVSGSDAIAVMNGEAFLHPVSGNPVEDPKAKIHMAFEFRAEMFE